MDLLSDQLKLEPDSAQWYRLAEAVVRFLPSEQICAPYVQVGERNN